MKDREKLLIEMISALNHLGLDWYHIMEDYFEYQIEKKTTEDLIEMKNIILNIRNDIHEFLHY
ncbi:hypothetical protein KJ966_29765 [bacterium]|nr:hypothetical protein [bacterium]